MICGACRTKVVCPCCGGEDTPDTLRERRRNRKTPARRRWAADYQMGRRDGVRGTAPRRPGSRGYASGYARGEKTCAKA